MSKHSESNIETWTEHLSALYESNVVADVANGIKILLAKYAPEILNSSVSKGLSESDVLLITYGDTLRESNTPPLQVLHRFHRDYLAGIFDLIHILPFHPYSSDDGFSVIDYKAIREDLGSWEDIESLSQDCRIMADAVVNHISSQSTWFREYLAGNPEFADFFIDFDPGEDLSAVIRPRTSPLLTRFVDGNDAERHVWTTFSADQVDLNYRNPDVLLAMIDVLFFLISKGARLLRLDAVTFLWKQPGTSSANLEETHLLIKIMRSAISMLRNDVVVITETNVPHRENVAYFGDGHDEAHMVYNFALPPLLAHSFIEGNSRHLSDWASQLELPSDDVCFLNFSSSHDGVGVRPVEEILNEGELQGLVDATESAGGLVSSRTLGDGKVRPYELNCTYLDLISRTDDDTKTLVDRFVALQAIVLAMPGMPAIYIQSLLGTRNDLELVRQTGRARSINRSQHEYSDIAAALSRPASLEARVFERLTHLIRVRRQHAAFAPYAPFEVLDYGTSMFAMRRRDPQSDATITCINNLTGKEVLLEISDSVSGQELLADAYVPAGNHLIPPYAVWWLLAG